MGKIMNQVAEVNDIWDFSVRCDFIKIDVEGFEGNVIQGATNVLNTFKPKVVLELNHWCLNAFRRISVPDFFDMLRTFFPVLYAVDTDNITIKNLHDPDDALRNVWTYCQLQISQHCCGF